MAAVAMEEHLILLREYSTLKRLLDTHKRTIATRSSKTGNGNPYSFVRSTDKSFTKYSPKNYKITRLSTQKSTSGKPLLNNSLTSKLNIPNSGRSQIATVSAANVEAVRAIEPSTSHSPVKLVADLQPSLNKKPERNVLTKIQQSSSKFGDNLNNKQSSKYKIRNIADNNIGNAAASQTNLTGTTSKESSKYSWKANDSDNRNQSGDSKINDTRLRVITPDKRLVRKGKYRLVKLKNSPKSMNRIKVNKVSPKLRLKSKISNRKLKSTYWSVNKANSRFSYNAVNGCRFPRTALNKSPGRRWSLHSTQSTKNGTKLFGQQKMIVVDGVQFILNGNRRRLCKGKQKLRKSLEGSEILFKSKTAKKFTPMQNFANRAVHRSIFRLNVAKQKSKKFCLFYNKFGKCNKIENGNCPYIHDPEKIAICKRFLQGSCIVENCPFAHTRCRTKMPTCNFFILGSCHNGEACNYSHVNVGRDADVCLDFVNGYCPAGEKCKKWHLTRCIKFEQTGNCDREKCPLIHRKKNTEHLHSSSIKNNSTAQESPDILSLKTCSKIQWESSEKPLPAFIPINDNTSTSSISGLGNSALQIRPNFLTGKR